MRSAKECRAVEKGVQVAAACDFHAGDSSIGFSELAISCASARGGFFSRLASSKHSGDAASPIASFGGRSTTIGTSGLVALVDVVPQRLSKPLFNRLIHAHPFQFRLTEHLLLRTTSGSEAAIISHPPGWGEIAANPKCCFCIH